MSRKTLVCMGEALIDFIPLQKGVGLDRVEQFERAVGGAPLNVAGCAAKLGSSARMITRLGNDGFGRAILNAIKSLGVDTRYVKMDLDAYTALAFVALKEDGNREFSFLRKDCADSRLDEADLSEEMFADCAIFHFCSVALKSESSRKAHRKAIEWAKKQGALISFDPNLRLNLWESDQDCLDVVRQFLPFADIVKISDEELQLIMKTADPRKAAELLFAQGVKILLYTRGAQGASIYFEKGELHHAGYRIEAMDTTGAGDCFAGAFLHRLIQSESSFEELDERALRPMLRFANLAAACSSTKKGALPSLPDEEELARFAASFHEEL